jgi:hypothetical protein
MLKNHDVCARHFGQSIYDPITRKKVGHYLNNIIYIIGLVVVVFFVLSYFSLRQPGAS